MRHANVVILTDETEFARLLTACWQAERQAPNITVINSDSWQEQNAQEHDLVVVGPVRDGKITSVLRSLEPATAVILCIPPDSQEFGQLRTKYPRLLHIPLREDWLCRSRGRRSETPPRTRATPRLDATCLR